jgi:hypothetical protein
LHPPTTKETAAIHIADLKSSSVFAILSGVLLSSQARVLRVGCKKGTDMLNICRLASEDGT